MRITHQTNHALRLLMYCAANPDRLSKVPVIAVRYGISETHLFKILPILSRGKLLETVRGRAGGVRLARPASGITVGNVVRLTEERFALADCFEDPEANCPLIANCRLHGVWQRALDAFMAVLDGTTIADLVGEDHRIAAQLGLDIVPAQAV
ncbi:MAG: Rrf2 family transcriptional regulator [Pseudomonadota bacterium]